MGNWGYFTLINGVITLLITSRGPLCMENYITEIYSVIRTVISYRVLDADWLMLSFGCGS